VVAGENLRRKDLSCDYHNSMGLKSGEYGDKLIILAPTASIIGAIEAILCAVRADYPLLLPLLPKVPALKTFR
jgi:hypothetical protein